ncbi:transposase [Citrobacter sp. Cb220]|uniref:transposase n=2 Tax=unclassified Citrobacter TaxID=2644389 RepID=UPI00336A152E
MKMVERSDRPEISVAKLAREHGINDNRLFKWPNVLCHYRLTRFGNTTAMRPEHLPLS